MSLLANSERNIIKPESLMGPAAALFISANIANAANLLFNMIFARLMGPTAFADLTLLLTLKLGVLSFLGAVQFAFAEFAAKEKNTQVIKIKAHIFSWQSLKLSVPIMFVILALSNFISSALNFSSPQALCILALVIPFFVPLVIFRGLTQGLIDLPKIILSIQAEWIIRLFGSILLWKMGFGLPGIAVAVVLSIVAGFLFSTEKGDLRGHRSISKLKASSDIKTVSAAAVPYLILQIAQVVVLDSDILVAKASFSPEMAGLVAGLLLIQRIFFFAFLSCSMILQPFVAKQTQEQKTRKELLMLLMAITVITTMALLIIVPNSDLVVSLMLGEQYKALSSIIWISALTGAVFIVSHLCAIYQIAHGRTLAAKIVLIFSVFQLFSLLTVNHFFPDIGLYSYFSLKLAIQTLCALCLLGIIMFPRNERDTPANDP